MNKYLTLFYILKISLLTFSVLLFPCKDLASKVVNFQQINTVETKVQTVQKDSNVTSVLIPKYQQKLQVNKPKKNLKVEKQFILDMFQDKVGNIWFSISQGGVIKYDGSSFTKFTTNEGLLNNTILNMIQDKTGNIWFSTLSGISIYDGESFTRFMEVDSIFNNSVFKMYKQDTTYQENIVVNCMMDDRLGNIWFGSLCGVSKYDGKKITNYTVEDGLSDNHVRKILQDKIGNIYLGTGDGLSKYDGNTFTQFGKNDYKSNNSCVEMIIDTSGTLWVSTIGHISKFNSNLIIPSSELAILNNYVVYSMFQDKSGNIWFGTDVGGVFKYDGRILKQFTQKDGLVSNTVLTIIQDKAGNLWFATDIGVSKYDGKSFSRFQLTSY